MSMQPQPDALAVLIPIYDDWDAVAMLLPRLDESLHAAHLGARVILVDDGSTTEAPAALSELTLKAIERVEVLTLRRNLGHQRAIAIGLAFIAERMPVEAVVVMDGDGEDAPGDVPHLVAEMRNGHGARIVFAERRRRSESTTFRVLYHSYRWAHRALTGIPVRVGNFSVIPATQLRRLVSVSELWNHYAAAVFKARLPRVLVPTTRATRLQGRSRMNFVSLVGHGLSALSVHAEIIGVRMLCLAAILTVLVGALLGVVVGLKLWTTLAIPGWATNAVGLLVVVLLQTLAFAVLFVFLVLHARSHPSFLLIRDYEYFVSGTVRVFPAARATALPVRPPREMVE
ncbi:MAG TPA: glycosyltransferase [Vicinamibacterales bacterium]|nr:glycosyltransferase [Vicinamibacterales bacterium]